LQLIVDLARVEKLKGVVNTKYRLEQVNYALIALNERTIVGRGYFDPLL
jgi:D-arabinose 1-dehydrogenase-like Zn-dependent alcohol dehydrogenase